MANLKQHKSNHRAVEWKAFSHSPEPHEYISNSNYLVLMWNFKRDEDHLFICILCVLATLEHNQEDNLSLLSAKWSRTKPISDVFAIDWWPLLHCSATPLLPRIDSRLPTIKPLSWFRFSFPRQGVIIAQLVFAWHCFLPWRVHRHPLSSSPSTFSATEKGSSNREVLPVDAQQVRMNRCFQCTLLKTAQMSK